MRSRARTASATLLLVLAALLVATPDAPGQTVIHAPAAAAAAPKCTPDLAKKKTGKRCRDELWEFCTKDGGKGVLTERGCWDKVWQKCPQSGSALAPVPPELQSWCAAEAKRRPQPAQPPPAAPAPTGQTEPSDGQPDVLTPLGGTSPFCKRTDLDQESRESCKSGSIQREFPLSHYGLDHQAKPSITHLQDNIPALLQEWASMIWTMFTWMVSGALVLLDWSFSIDPLGDSLKKTSEAMKSLHEDVLGKPWTLAALAIAGAWGIWNGLIRLQTSKTLTSLGATVALMIVALLIIYKPFETVGRVGKLANDSSLSILGAASNGTVKDPVKAYATRQRGLFDALIVRPWCALQFGDVNYCHEETKKKGLKNVDLWLAFPAGSDPRTALYQAVRGNGKKGWKGWVKNIWDELTGWVIMPQLMPLRMLRKFQSLRKKYKLKDIAGLPKKNAEKVKMQEAGGAISRLGTLCLIVVGLIGAILVLLWLGIRLITASIFSLILLLMTPIMLLAPAFGDGGRHGFGTWLKRLLGALLAKLIYSGLLAIVLLIAGIIPELGLSWYGTWLIFMGFWWGVFLKRKQLVGYISFDRDGAPGGAGGGGGGTDPLGAMTRLYFAQRAARELGGMAINATGVPKATRAMRAERFARRQGGESVIRNRSRRELSAGARNAIGLQKQAELGRAQEILQRGQGLEHRLNDINETIGWNQDPDQRVNLLRDKREIEDQFAEHHAAPETKWANSTATRYGDGIPEPTEAEIDTWQEQRRQGVAAWRADPRSWSSDNNLRAAGIHPDDLRAAVNEGEHGTVQEIRSRSNRALQRHETLLGRSSEQALPSSVRHGALREYYGMQNGQLFGSNPEVSRELIDANRGARAERRQHRTREKVYRR